MTSRRFLQGGKKLGNRRSYLVIKGFVKRTRSEVSRSMELFFRTRSENLRCLLIGIKMSHFRRKTLKCKTLIPNQQIIFRSSNILKMSDCQKNQWVKSQINASMLCNNQIVTQETPTFTARLEMNQIFSKNNLLMDKKRNFIPLSTKKITQDKIRVQTRSKKRAAATRTTNYPSDHVTPPQ